MGLRVGGRQKDQPVERRTSNAAALRPSLEKKTQTRFAMCGTETLLNNGIARKLRQTGNQSSLPFYYG